MFWLVSNQVFPHDTTIIIEHDKSYREIAQLLILIAADIIRKLKEEHRIEIKQQSVPTISFLLKIYCRYN